MLFRDVQVEDFTATFPEIRERSPTPFYRTDVHHIDSRWIPEDDEDRQIIEPCDFTIRLGRVQDERERALNARAACSTRARSPLYLQ